MDLVKTEHAPKQKQKKNYSIAPDVKGFNILFVNYYTIGEPGMGNDWWLVDAGLPGSARRILKETGELYGKYNPPKGIILTHGHFDHVGALPMLMKEWPEVKIYVHSFELQYLTGKASYPPPDPAAGGGGMSGMSWLFPRKSVNLEGHVEPLKDDGTIPGLPDWKYIHTPGHAPGHISLFRENDRRLIAGDAFVTTNQNEMYSSLTQRKELHAPPAYFTINWNDAKNSIQRLVDLEPEAAGTGHGVPFYGKELREGLRTLLDEFEMKEVPPNGHYVKHPVKYSDGRVREVKTPTAYWVALAAAGTVLGLGLATLTNKIRNNK